jgi:hypothetical protein
MTGNMEIDLDAGSLRLTGQDIGLALHQLRGLTNLLRFNCEMVSADGRDEKRNFASQNALLSCFAALEALILETGHCRLPELYADDGWRGASLGRKYRKFLETCGRAGDSVPPFVAEIAKHRRALTHSEPDNPRTGELGNVIASRETAAYLERFREVAEWLWAGDPPEQHRGIFPPR